MKNLVLTAMLTAMCSMAFANEREISRQSFTGKTYANSLQCRDGSPGSFPLDLEIYMSTGYSSGSIYFPSKLLLQNTPEVNFRGTPNQKCAEFADIIRAEGEIDLTGEKVITTNSIVRPDNGLCQTEIRETLTITIKRVKLEGLSTFIVYPAPMTDCQ